MKTIRLPLLLLALIAHPLSAAAADDISARLSKLESQLQNQGLLNLLNQVEALKAEVARLRGTQEELAYQQSAADKRAKDLLSDMDDRLKELESRPVAVAAPANVVRLQPAQALSSPATQPGTEPSPRAAADGESKAYENAHNMIKAGRYKEAVLAMQDFVKAYPDSGLVPNAHYWTGFSYVGMSDFESAAASYQFLIDSFPNAPKTPDALLSLARAQVQMNRPEDATATLGQLIERFPYSRAADGGKKLLSTLK
jgi:tol-pal system protein YbgF